ncbi:MAG: YidH family protein, partial [Sulfurifustaceae bacterium]
MSELSDPRVLFAAERTLLAWNRTSLALIAFGFVVERAALFARIVFETPRPPEVAATWIGVAFILVGTTFAVLSIVQYRRALRALKRSEVPSGYFVNLAVYANAVVALLGIALAV